MNGQLAVRITDTKHWQNRTLASHRQQGSGRCCSGLTAEEGNFNPLFAPALVYQQGNYFPSAEGLHYVRQPAFLVDDSIAKTGSQMIQQPIRPRLLHLGGNHREGLVEVLHIMLGNFPVPYVGCNDKYTVVSLQSILQNVLTIHFIYA